MDVENLPPLTTPDHGNVRNPDRPILSYAWQGQGPHRAALQEEILAGQAGKPSLDIDVEGGGKGRQR